jgi:hypothetical protein
MGTLCAIPPNIDLGALDLNQDALAVARALQDYGAYVVDSANQFVLYAEPGANIRRVNAVRDQLVIIRAQLRVVENSAPDNIAGGGARRKPLAAPLGTI